MRCGRRAAVLGAAVWLAQVQPAGAASSNAASLNPATFNPAQRLCATGEEPTATQIDRLLRLSAVAQQRLADSGVVAALVARSGLDLSRIGHRYSHAGVALQANPLGAWAVRQLYYTCDEQRPHIYDQGLAGFAVGAQQPQASYLSLVLLPPDAAAALARTALQAPIANALIGQHYSANAYAQSLIDQNCNQWVAELMALAWAAPQGGTRPGGATQGSTSSTGSPSSPNAAVPPAAAVAAHPPTQPLADGEAAPPATSSSPPAAIPPAAINLTATHLTATHPRAVAQAALFAQGYTASVITPSPLVRIAGAFIPWLSDHDHPASELAQGRYHVTLPASLEAWVRQRWPAARRVELCVNDTHIVLREGWQPLEEGCVPGVGDEVMALR